MRKKVPPKVVRIIRLIQYISEYPPKSIQQIANHLEVHQKTAYKDVELLSALGYETEKNQHRAYALKYHRKETYQLTDDEKKLIINILPKAGLVHTAVQSIVSKLKTTVFPDQKSQTIFRQLYIIKTLIDAIKMRHPVRIIGYRSTNPQSAEKDRMAIPLHLDDTHEACTCFDLETTQIRIYKTSRMQDITLCPKQEITLPEYIPEVDIFGIAGRMDYKIFLALTKRSATILTEEFGVNPSDFEATNEGIFIYAFSLKVCGYEGVGRFVLGLMTEIKVIGDDGFKAYLSKKIAEMTIF